MRKCEVTHCKTPNLQVKVETAKFHCWGSDFKELENGVGNYTSAIVELDDGRVVRVSPRSIRFLPEEPAPTYPSFVIHRTLVASAIIQKLKDSGWTFAKIGRVGYPWLDQVAEINGHIQDILKENSI